MIEDRFIIARDRIGIVPLYYKFEKNSFIFSSQLKGIEAFKNKVPSLNKNKISHIFRIAI